MSDFDAVQILLVEDNSNDAEMAMRALKKSNFLNKLHWVQDGVEALDFIRCTGQYESRDRTEIPKLILLDLKMPRLDGLDVLRALKSDAGTRSIPIVVMTSSSQERDLAESYHLGVNGYVPKPIKFPELVDIMTKIGMYWLLVNRVPS
jgi:two-component system response regulator